MKTLLFSNQGLSPLHFGIELEIAQKEINQGNELHILYCKSNLQTCYFNPNHNLLACSICESRVHNFYNELKILPSHIKPLKNLVSKIDTPKINQANDIFKISYKGYDTGRGIAASYISSRRNYEYKEEDHPYINEMALMTANVVENLEASIKVLSPDKVIIFNGRFAELNAVIEVCKKLKVDYYTFERSSAKNKYRFYKNVIPHSISFRNTDMEKIWEEGDHSKRNQIAENWFNNRLNKDSEDMKKFLAKQTTGYLPNGFDSSKQNVGIFIASEDEHKAVKEHDFKQYESQNEAIEKLLNKFSKNDQIHFYLRVHPHLRNLDTAQVREIEGMQHDNLTIIHAHEKVDSYELMKSCDKVLSFGSTTGIEATYHGKTSISFGHSYYENLDCCYFPQTFEELYSLISNPNLPPKEKSSTYKYSYYQSMVGFEFEKFNFQGKTNSFFDSKPIKRVYFKTILLLIRNLSQIGQWKKMNRIIFKTKLSFKNAFKLNSHVMNDKLR